MNLGKTGLFALALGSSFAAGSVYAQAWVPTEHSLSVSLEYGLVWSSNDVQSPDRAAPDATPDKVPNANLLTHLFIPTIDYTPVANLGIKLWLPLVISGCTDDTSCPHNHPTAQENVDDGSKRFTLQDINLELRYMIDIPDVITFAPLIGASVPTHDYPTVGHAVAGRGRPQLRFGVNVGRALSEIIPGAYIHGRYQFAYVFPLKKNAYSQSDLMNLNAPDASMPDAGLDLSINRSSFDLELGYFIIEDLSIRLTSHYELTHGGIEYGAADYFPADSPKGGAGLNHDVLGAERYLLVGGGLTYILFEDLFLSATFLKWVTGANTHDSDSINFAVSYQIF